MLRSDRQTLIMFISSVTKKNMDYQFELQYTIFIMASFDKGRRRLSLVSVVILALLDEVLFPSQGLSQLLLRLCPFMNLGEEGYCQNKVTLPSGTQGSARSGVQHTNL